MKQLRYIIGLTAILLLAACTTDVEMEDPQPRVRYTLRITWTGNNSLTNRTLYGKLTNVPLGSVQKKINTEVPFEAHHVPGSYTTNAKGVAVNVYVDSTLYLPLTLPASVRCYTEYNKQTNNITVDYTNRLITVDKVTK